MRKDFFEKITLLLSFMVINLLLIVGNSQYVKFFTVFNLSVTFIISYYLIFKKDIMLRVRNIQVVFGKKADYVISLGLGIVTAQIFHRSYFGYNSTFRNFINIISNKIDISFDLLWQFICLILFIFSIFGLMLVWLFFIRKVTPKIKDFCKSLTILEKRYITVFGIIVVLLSLIIQIQTNAFTTPISAGNSYIEMYDVLYTTDNGIQISYDSFLNILAPENDLRQPLFALFSYPFAIIAQIGTMIFNMLPHNLVYSYLIVCLQGLALIICSVLLARMLNKQSNVFSLLLFSFMYATIFFTFNVEQYVFGVFWLILLLYNFVNYERVNINLFLAATGSLVTNAVLLPFMLRKDKIKDFINNCFKYGVYFLILIIVTGRTYTVTNGIVNFGKYESAMGIDITFFDKLLQFINFIAGCFIAPKGMIDTEKFYHISYQLYPSTTINILGVLLLVIMIFSFIFNRKKKIAKISFGWLLFSFLILCVIGWGTVENGLIIYGIYFSWAYFILVYLFIESILKKCPKVKTIIYILIFIILLVFNGKTLIDIVEFGKNYYPFKL